MAHYYISGGITSSNIELDSEDYMYITSGGMVTSTVVNSGAWMDICEGGTAEKTTVNSGGRMTVSSGGTAKDINVGCGAELSIYSGIISGTIDLAGSMYIFSGTHPKPVQINIDLSKRHVYDYFMVQDGELFTNADWQITIDDKQAIGRYSIH